MLLAPDWTGTGLLIRSEWVRVLPEALTPIGYILVVRPDFGRNNQYIDTYRLHAPLAEWRGSWLLTNEMGVRFLQGVLIMRWVAGIPP